MSEKQNPQLEQTLKAIAPDKAASILKKYESVMGAIDDSLTSEKSDTAIKAKDHLGAITRDLLEITDISADPILTAQRVELVTALDQELDLLSDTFAPRSLDPNAVEVATANFWAINDLFGENGISIDMNAYLDGYMALPDSMRIPSEVIRNGMESIFAVLKSSTDPVSKYFEIVTIFGLYCNGSLDVAESRVKDLLRDLDFMRDLKEFKTKAGLESLSDPYVNLLLSTLSDNGIDQKQAIAYLNKLKELSEQKLDFKNIRLDQPVFVEFLVGSILAYRDAEKSKNEKSKKHLALVLKVEATTSAKQREAEKDIPDLTKQLEGLQKELTDYKKEHPETVLDEYIVEREAKMTVLLCNLFAKQVFLNTVKSQYDLAMAYLQKPFIDVNSPTTTKDLDIILNGPDKDIKVQRPSEWLRIISNKYQLVPSNNILIVEVFETKLAKAIMDDQMAQSKADPKRLSDYKKFVENPHSSIIAESVAEDLENQTDSLLNVFHELSPRVKREHEYFESYKAEYDGIDKVPDTIRAKLAGRLSSYMMLLEDYYDLQAKMVGNLSMLQLLHLEAFDLPKSVLPDFHIFTKGEVVLPVPHIKDGFEPYDLTFVHQEEPPSIEHLPLRMKLKTNIEGIPLARGNFGLPIEDVMTKFETSGEDSYNELLAVAKYLNADKYKPADFDAAMITPLHMAFLAKEIPVFKPDLQTMLGDVSKSFEPLESAGNKFQKYAKDPSFWKLVTGGESDLRKELHHPFYDAAEKIGLARFKVEDNQRAYVRLLQNPPAGYETNPRLLKLYKTTLTQLIELCDDLLDNTAGTPESAKSPISKVIYDRISAASHGIYKFFEERPVNVLKAIAATVVIIAAAVAVAIVFAPAGAAVGGGLTTAFGLGGTAAGTFLTFTSTMAFVSLGGVFGSRLGMGLTNLTGLTDISIDQILDPGQMATDWAWGFILSMAACGAARYVIIGLQRGALAYGTAGRVGVFARLSPDKARWALQKLDVLNTFASPEKWFSAEHKAASFLRRFGVEYAEELTETGGQTTAQSASEAAGLSASGPIGEVVGFLMSFASAADGTNINLQSALSTELIPHVKDLGLALEGNQITYSKSSAEFITKFKAAFPNVKFDITFDPKTGVIIARAAEGKFKAEFHPAAVKLSPEVEMARVPGIETDPVTNALSISNANNVLPALVDLRALGFALTRTKTGIKATKGDLSVEIKTDLEVLAKFEQTLNDTSEELGLINRLLTKLKSKGNLSETEAGELNFGLSRVLATFAAAGLVTGTATNAFAEGVADAAKGVAAEYVLGPVAELLLFCVDVSVPVIMMWKTAWSIPSTFKEFRVFWGQVKNSGLLGSIQEHLDQFKVSGDTNLAKTGLELEALLQSIQTNIGLTLEEALSKVRGIHKPLAKLEVNKIIANLQKLSTIADKTSPEFQNTVTAIKQSFDALKTIPGVSLPKLSVAFRVAIGWIVYLLLRKTLLTGENLAKLFLGVGLEGILKKEGGGKGEEGDGGKKKKSRPAKPEKGPGGKANPTEGGDGSFGPSGGEEAEPKPAEPKVEPGKAEPKPAEPKPAEPKVEPGAWSG